MTFDNNMTDTQDAGARTAVEKSTDGQAISCFDSTSSRKTMTLEKNMDMTDTQDDAEVRSAVENSTHGQVNACIHEEEQEVKHKEKSHEDKNSRNNGESADLDENVEQKEEQTIEDVLRKTATGIAGGALIAVGIPLVPLPGPGFAIIGGGLAVLAKEFPAAQNILDKSKQKIEEFAEHKDEEDSLGLGFEIVDNPNEKEEDPIKTGIKHLRHITKTKIVPFMNSVGNKNETDECATKNSDEVKPVSSNKGKSFWELSL